MSNALFVTRALESKNFVGKILRLDEFRWERVALDIIRTMNMMIQEGTLLSLTAFFPGAIDAVGIVTRVVVTRGMQGNKKTAQGIPIPALHRFRCELLVEEKLYEIDFHIWFDTTGAGAALSLTYTRVDSWTRIRQPCWILDGGIS